MSANVLRDRRIAARLTQEQLAEKIGSSQGYVAKLERGERRITLDLAVKFAEALGGDPTEYLPELNGSRPTSAAPPQPASGAKQIPVRAAARAGADQEMFLGDGPIDWVDCPSWLAATCSDAYAMYVTGDSMVPRFRPRQLLFVSPRRPPSPGDGVIVVRQNQAVLIKELVGWTAEGITLREYGPAVRDFVVPQADVEVVHTVTGLREPV